MSLEEAHKRIGPPPDRSAVVHEGPCVLCGAQVICWAYGPVLPGTVYFCGVRRCPRWVP